jgi:hypothetical protein
MTAPDPAEAVLWRGKPSRYPVLHRSDVLFVPFSVFFAAFAAYFFVVPGWNRGTAFDRTIAVLLTAIALYQLLGRLVVRQLVLRGTDYVVTDRQVVIESTLFGRKRTRSLRLGETGPPVLKAAEDGTGSISFGDGGFVEAVFARPGQVPELEQVTDARQVRDLIAEAQRKAMSGGR